MFDPLSHNYSAYGLLFASIAGSPHCVGMCGGFVALYSGGSNRSSFDHLFYSLGRLSTYLFLASGAFVVGSGFSGLLNQFGVSHAAALFVAGMLILWGVGQLFGFKWLIAGNHISSRIWRLFSHKVSYLLGQRDSMNPRYFSYLLGSGTTFLPCGWLYAFVLYAGAQESLVSSLATMGVFWLGTLPAMVGFGTCTQFLSARIRRVLPQCVALMMIVAGVYSLHQHLSLHHNSAGSRSDSCPHHHSHGDIDN